MVIDSKSLDSLSAQAKASPRLRLAMDLRNSPDDLMEGRNKQIYKWVLLQK